MFVMGNDRADLAAKKISCSVSSLVAGKVDMAWNPTQNNTFSRIRPKKISVLPVAVHP